MGLEMRAHPGDMAHDVARLVELDGLERDGGGNRMAAIGEAVAEGADLAAFGLDGIGQISADSITAEIGR